MASLISIGVTGLTASQTALTTSGNNITNANTPGYSRQRANLSTLQEQFTGGSYQGSGVQVQSITRVVEQFAIGQLRTSTSSFNESDVLTTQYEQLDSLLADSSTGIAPALQGLFDSLQQASQDPTSLAVRQVVLSGAGSLTQRFNALYGQLQAQSTGINEQLTAATGQVTSLAKGIASLNQNIADQQGTGATPNDLLDKRDELMRQLSELVGVKVVDQNNGMVNVFIGNGQPLVVGNQSNTVATAPSALDASKLDVVFTSGSASQSISSFLTGGKVGGLLKFRDTNLSNALNVLGRIAITFADALNQQQQLGLDLNGNQGNPLFTDINAPASQTARVLSSTNNPGTANLGATITNTSLLTTSDYQLNITAAGGYSLLRLSDGVTVASGATLPTAPATIATPDGFQLDLSSGAFAAGDQFLIQPTRLGSRQIDVALQKPEELAFAQPIRTGATLTNSGTGTISTGTMVAPLPTPTALTPPIIVSFTSPTAYQILDNSNPAAPTAFVPPVTGTIVPGQTNTISIHNPVTAATNTIYSFDISGHPATGDTFTVDFNSNGSSDNRNALAMIDFKLAKTMSGNQSFSDAYGQLVSGVGARTAELKISRDAADTLLTQAQTNRDSISGVNLDEEAANLVKFEQAYNASAQVISIARSIFDTLLGAFR